MSFKAKPVPCPISMQSHLRALHSQLKAASRANARQLLQHPFPKPRPRGSFGAHSVSGREHRELAHGLNFGERCSILQQRLEFALPRAPQVGVVSVLRVQRQACQRRFDPSERGPGT